MAKIIIDDEIRDLLPPRNDDEATRLKDAILLDGCREPLVLWKGHGMLLDGHGRYEICQANKVKFNTVYISLPNRAAAIEWVVNNQLAKRNLTDERRAYYIGKQYLSQKKQIPSEKVQRAQNDPVGKRTAETIAEQHHVSPATVKRAALFAKSVDELPATARDTILDGKSGATQKEVASKQFCSRCTRLGPTKGCTACVELRKESKKPPREPGVEETKKRTGSGKVKFDWRDFESGFGVLMRQIDRVGNNYDCKETDEANALRDQLAKFRKSFTAWFRKSAGLGEGRG